MRFSKGRRKAPFPFTGRAKYGGRANRYSIRSRGRDNAAQGTTYNPGAITDFDCDLVFSNGTFITYPEGVVADSSDGSRRSRDAPRPLLYFASPAMRTLRASSLVLASIVALILTGTCRDADAVPARPIEREARRWLVDYLKIDTSNPPGNETTAAKWLQGILAREGIDAQLVGDDPARQSVYARLHSGSSEPALILLHHLDVVPVTAGEWTVPPFSGSQSGGYIWGRGALDIKSLGIAQLSAFLELKRKKLPLARDVIYLGVADEEAGGLRGTAALLEKHPELFAGAGYAINEGGTTETIVDKVSYWGIEVEQKIPLWFELTARGAAGHGASPPDDGGSTGRLIAALESIRKLERPYRVTPGVDAYFKALAAVKPGRKGEIMRDIGKHVDAADFTAIIAPTYRVLLHDTFAVTRLEAGDSINSIPAAARAQADIRLLPDGDAAAELERIRQAVGDRADIRVVLQGARGTSSPIDSPLYDAIAAAMKRAEPTSVVGPAVSAGTSDSRFLRARGIQAYGVAPFKVNYYDADSVHGIDERIRAHFFDEGVILMRDIVRSFAVRS
ncbi:MAG: M20/M25/M40 family metallo-hydrolase [Thermoanaerobaculia bacterium]